MGFSESLTLDDSAIIGPLDKLEVHFDDPPGPSPARCNCPIRDREKLLEDLTSNLGNESYLVQIGGVYSSAYTGESYAIVLFVLGGVAGGILGALGQDVWDAIKKTISKAVQSNGARRNVVEVAFEFEECDIIFHVESRSPDEIPHMFDDANAALMQLKEKLAKGKDFPSEVEAIEIRSDSQTGKTTNILYSYRRARMMMNDLSEKPETNRGSKGDVGMET